MMGILGSPKLYVLHPATGTPQGGILTPPTKLQTFFFGVRIASVWIDPKHDIDVMSCHFDALDESADEIPLAHPVGLL